MFEHLGSFVLKIRQPFFRINEPVFVDVTHLFTRAYRKISFENWGEQPSHLIYNIPVTKNGCLVSQAAVVYSVKAVKRDFYINAGFGSRRIWCVHALGFQRN